MEARKFMKQHKDTEVDDRFGMLTVVAYAGRIKYSNNNNRKHWIYKCDCGQEKICNDSLLKKGAIKSCGCLKISKNKNRKRHIINFVQWCNKNIDKDIYQIWDYQNNIFKPDEIDCSDLEQNIYALCPIHGSYSKKLKRFFDNADCSTCIRVKNNENILAIKYPKIQDIWSDKNNFTPYDITYNSSKKIWLKCSNNRHNDYNQYIRNAIRSDCECPLCVKERKISKAQIFVNNYLNELGYDVLHEYDCNIIAINPKTGRLMPYDNEIAELKLIIEVNGVQHYQEKSSWNVLNAKQNNISLKESLTQQKYRDNFKKQYAIDNGYNFIEIPYWHIYNNSFKQLINAILSKNCSQALTVATTLSKS